MNIYITFQTFKVSCIPEKSQLHRIQPYLPTNIQKKLQKKIPVASPSHRKLDIYKIYLKNITHTPFANSRPHIKPIIPIYSTIRISCSAWRKGIQLLRMNKFFRLSNSRVRLLFSMHEKSIRNLRAWDLARAWATFPPPPPPHYFELPAGERFVRGFSKYCKFTPSPELGSVGSALDEVHCCPRARAIGKGWCAICIFMHVAWVYVYLLL